MPEGTFLLFAAVVAASYVYAFVGGFTDAANAIATSVGSRVLSMRAAVAVAAVFNLLGGLTGTAVAATIGAGLIDPALITLPTVLAAVAGAMSWSLFTYRLGIPVSETHGLVGGILGAGLATGGTGVVRWEGVIPSLSAILASPALGFAGGFALMALISWTLRGARRSQARPAFVNLQRLSAAYMAFSHGRNDAQKPMGILALGLTLHYGYPTLEIPLWVVVSCSFTAALGTAWGGWRIIKSVGVRLTRLDPVQGFAAQVAGASVIQAASELGIPVSTTHAITSSILGVGYVQRRKAVRWGLAQDILYSWVLTLPVTIVLGALYGFGLNAVL
jgi:inorganic phosphate transporter, PiT family